jgi:hypothetical protein
MTDRTNTIAEYLNEVKMLPPANQLRGLLKRWPEVTAEEFESAVKIFNARNLNNQEQELLELVKKKTTLESLGARSPVTDDNLDSLWQEHWRQREQRIGLKRH